MSTSGDSQQYLTEFMMQDEEDGDGAASDESEKQSDSKFMLRDQDRFLPICNIIKIMKVPVPDNGKIAKDARECIQETVSEFISFITSEAIERSIAENRKTVNGDDLLYAFANLGFENYVEPLSIYLHKFREVKEKEELTGVLKFIEQVTSTTSLQATKSDRNLYDANLVQDESSSEIPKTNDTGCSNTINETVTVEATSRSHFSSSNSAVNITQVQNINIIAEPITSINTNVVAAPPLRRSERLLSRPSRPLPIIKTVPNHMTSSINTDQLLFLDADDLMQNVQKHQHFLIQNNGGNTFMHI